MPRCTGTILTGRRCRNDAAHGRERCGVHALPEDMIEDQRNAEIVWDIVQAHIGRPEAVLRILRHFRAGGVLTNRWAETLLVRAINRAVDHRARWEFMVEWAGIQDMDQVGDRRARWELLMEWAGIEPRNLEGDFEAVRHEMRQETLADIARDSQGVHRTPVSEHTNRAIQSLLNTPVPPEWPQETLSVAFRGLPRRVILDVREWYRKDTCIAENDCLYRQLLNAIICRADVSPHKEEIIRRFHEEATESVGTCCMGHITRLCNVLVGFDPEFDPPVPTGELLQQKMAALSQSQASVEEKVLDAWRIMDELHIPEAERTAWIDAL